MSRGAPKAAGVPSGARPFGLVGIMKSALRPLQKASGFAGRAGATFMIDCECQYYGNTASLTKLITYSSRHFVL